MTIARTDPADPTDPFEIHIGEAEAILGSIAATNKGGAHAIAHALIALAYVIRDEMAEPVVPLSPPPPPPYPYSS